MNTPGILDSSVFVRTNDKRSLNDKQTPLENSTAVFFRTFERETAGVTKRFCLPPQLSPLFRLNLHLKKISEQKFVSKKFSGFAALKHSPKKFPRLRRIILFWKKTGCKGSQLKFTTCFQCTHFYFVFYCTMALALGRQHFVNHFFCLHHSEKNTLLEWSHCI